MSDLTRAAPTHDLADIWGASVSEVWLVGPPDTALHGDGASFAWARSDSGEPPSALGGRDASGVSGTDSSETPPGTILRGRL